MGRVGVPLIDLQDTEGLPEKLVKVCQETGCFRVVNHGVPSELLAEMKAVTAAIFDLPEEVKNKVSKPRATNAYSAYTPVFESTGIYDFTIPGATDEFCDQLGLSPHQREVVMKYNKTLQDVAGNIGRKLKEGLGLDGEMFDGWSFTLRINRYNYNAETLGATGAVWHTDAGFLTILQDDDGVNGLEIMDQTTGETIPVDPVIGKSTLVINCGDVAKAWSNGRFCNVKHQVICYQPLVRHSMGVFVLAPKIGNVEAPAKLIDAEHPQRYVPFNYTDYSISRNSAKDVFGALDLYTVKSD